MKDSFYQTKAWKKTSKLYALSKSCLCEICHRPVYVDGITNYLPKEKRIKYVVHHKIELNETNYIDDNISLNWDNLQLLCIDCHNQIHGDSVVRSGLKFDELGNIVPISPHKKLIK